MPVPVTRRHDAHRFAQPRSAEISLNRDSSAFSQNAVSPWSLLQKLLIPLVWLAHILPCGGGKTARRPNFAFGRGPIGDLINSGATDKSFGCCAIARLYRAAGCSYNAATYRVSPLHFGPFFVFLCAPYAHII
jgi:hypothetical protein